jgi:hypothetical protein
MPSHVLAPRYIVDEAGRPTQVVLTVRDYKRLLAAWEDVADARDFAAAKGSAKSFVSLEEFESGLKRGKGKSQFRDRERT